MVSMSICSYSSSLLNPLVLFDNKRQHYPQFPSSFLLPTFNNITLININKVVVSSSYSSSKSAQNSFVEKKKRHFKVGEYPPPSNGYGNSQKSNFRDNNNRDRDSNSRNWDNNNNNGKNWDDNGKNWDNNGRNRDSIRRNGEDNGVRNRDYNGKNRENNNNSRNRDNNNNNRSRNWEDNGRNSRNWEDNGRNRDNYNNSRNWEDNGRNRDNNRQKWEDNGRNKDNGRKRENIGRNRDDGGRNRDIIPGPVRFPVRVGGIKNINKKMDRRNNAKAWACTVTEALSDLILKKQWLNALEVFKMLKEQPFYQPKEGTYMKLIVLLGRCGQSQRAQQLFDTMLEEGLDPTPQLYTALLSAYCRSNLIDPAFSLLDKMKSLPLCQPDVYTYSILIKACVDACRFDLVEKLYLEMSERSIVPNTVTQNTVLSGYGKAGEFEKMEKVLTGMLGSTSSGPDVWTMNTILGLFGNKGEIETMEKWYEKFRNYGIEPETRTFNILIGAYGKKHMYDKMSSVMEYMRKLSFPWTTSTYNNVIEAFSDVSDAKNMEHTFEQMRAEGIKADTKTFCCLIRGYANAGLFHKVISSAQLAGEMEIPENTSFFNAIIFACAKAGDLVEMERVFERMKEKHCRPDSSTYDVMMDVYKNQGMSDKVYDLEQEKEENIMVLDNGVTSDHSSQVDRDEDLET